MRCWETAAPLGMPQGLSRMSLYSDSTACEQAGFARCTRGSGAAGSNGPCGTDKAPRCRTALPKARASLPRCLNRSSAVGANGTCKELCLHSLFVMVKVLRVPVGNPLLWQLSLSGAWRGVGGRGVGGGRGAWEVEDYAAASWARGGHRYWMWASAAARRPQQVWEQRDSGEPRRRAQAPSSMPDASPPPSPPPAPDRELEEVLRCAMQPQRPPPETRTRAAAADKTPAGQVKRKEVDEVGVRGG